MNSKHTSGMGLKDFLYRKADIMGIPLSGTFELSPVCNFSCRMCYVRKTQQEVDRSPRNILSLEDWRTIARQARDAGMLYLLLTGGEPLLWPHFWTLYDELIDMGFLISINTNGSLIDEAAVEHFRRKPPVRINITLYGAGEESYRRLCGNGPAFSRVDRGIRNLLEAGVSVKLNCSLTPQNVADLERMTEYAKSQNIELNAVTYMFPPVRRNPAGADDFERFSPEDAAKYHMEYMRQNRSTRSFDSYLNHLLAGCGEPLGLDENCIDPLDGSVRCRAGKSSFWVSWDGWLMTCGMVPEPAVDLKMTDFASAWEMLKQKTAQVRMSGICRQCPSVNICHPCLASARAETGTSEGVPEYQCRMTREMYRIAREMINSNVIIYPGGNENEHA